MCENKDFSGIAMPPQKNNILQFNQYMKSHERPYIFYADLESLIKKNRWMCGNPEKSSDNLANIQFQLYVILII